MALPTDRNPVATAFAEGIRLFNDHRFFEAHEAWETAWMKSEGRERMFYHGLIQAAAAFVHLQNNRRKGAQLLYGKSLDKLRSFSGIYKGLSIGRLNAELADVFAGVLSEPAETPIDGASYVARAPQIEWSGQLETETETAASPPAPVFLKDETRRG